MTLAVTLALAGAVVAVFGLALSVVNWWRLRPDIFLIARVVEHPLLDGVWVPMLLRVHVSNGGAAGVTLGALEVTVKSGPGLTGQARPPYVIAGLEMPCRLDGSDIKAWDIDLNTVRAMFHQRPLRLGVDWYGRRHPWRRLTRKSELAQRLRAKSIDIDPDPEAPKDAGVSRSTVPG